MEKQSNNIGKTVLITFLVIVVIALSVFATYAWAKYTSATNGTATAEVAKWNVSATPGTLKFSKTFTHVVENNLAPGTNGSFTAALNVTGTEVDVAYEITIDEITNKPTNLIITDDDGNVLKKGSKITGTLPVGSTTVNEVITWNWPYETGTTDEQKAANDLIDTTDGQSGKTMSIKYTITAVQVKPQ